MCELNFTVQDTGQLRSPRREFASCERPENICKSGILLLVNMAYNGRSSLKQKGQALIDNNTLLRCLLHFLDGPDRPGGSITSGAFAPTRNMPRFPLICVDPEQKIQQFATNSSVFSIAVIFRQCSAVVRTRCGCGGRGKRERGEAVSDSVSVSCLPMENANK